MSIPVCSGGAMSGVHREAQSKHKGTCLETMIFLILPKQLTDSSFIFYDGIFKSGVGENTVRDSA